MIPSFDIPKTVSFFTDLLSFEVVRDDATYVILQKDNLNIHILRAGDIGEMEFYLEVDDLDAVWQQMKDKLGTIKIKPPFQQPYGMCEIHVAVPETKTLLFIGQPLA
ncbi:MAG: hypothetical protein ACKOE6_03930 [Flammeovirgaceae bacterium]